MTVEDLKAHAKTAHEITLTILKMFPKNRDVDIKEKLMANITCGEKWVPYEKAEAFLIKVLEEERLMHQKEIQKLEDLLVERDETIEAQGSNIERLKEEAEEAKEDFKALGVAYQALYDLHQDLTKQYEEAQKILNSLPKFSQYNDDYFDYEMKVAVDEKIERLRFTLCSELTLKEK